MSLLSLLTDFGLQDAYVGIMKAVVWGIAPGIQIVDLSHQIAPQDVVHGALVLWSAMDVFGPGSIHVVVVDPGVGSQRRAVLVQAGGHWLIGPDNGVLWPALARFPAWEAVELVAPAYQRMPVSATFHGRDVFAPAAGHLAAGVPMDAFGPAVTELQSLALFDAEDRPDGVCGRILCFDHFGNAITNIQASALLQRSPASIKVGRHRCTGLAKTFSDVPEGEPVAYIDSYGLLEIALRNGSARAGLGLARGDDVEIAWG